MGEEKQRHSTMSAVKDVAKSVTKKVSFQQNAPLVFVLIFALIMGAYLMFRTKNSMQKELDQYKEDVADTTRSLAQNMAYLAAQEASVKQPAALDNRTQHHSPTRKPGQPVVEQSRNLPDDYIARQNAPSTLVVRQDRRTSLGEGKANRSTVLSSGDRNSAFANQSREVQTVKAEKIPFPERTIAAGEFIPAVLETAINSDLPGMIRAVVTRPVFSLTGRITLIPPGSVLMGQYSSGVILGQQRIMAVWDRVTLPNGVTIAINSPGVDTLGRSGMDASHINTHFLKRFGEATLLSLIGAGTATVGVSPSDQYNSEAMYRAAIAESFNQSANQSLKQSYHIAPTLSVHQGAQINVFVAQDLMFPEDGEG